MVIKNNTEINISKEDEDKILEIKKLKIKIDFLLTSLIKSLYNENIDFETVQDIIYETDLLEFIDNYTVNKTIKCIYKHNT